MVKIPYDWNVVKSGRITDITIEFGYDAGDNPVRIDGDWIINDMKQALLGHPPRGLGSPDIHHGGQMTGESKHEVIPNEHRNNTALHSNKYNWGSMSVSSDVDGLPLHRKSPEYGGTGKRPCIENKYRRFSR